MHISPIWFEAIFLFFAGLFMCGVTPPTWLRILVGICGIIAGLLLVI